METVKSRVFNYLSGPQKSELCHFVSKFVKKHIEKPTEEIADLFLEEEEYYINIDSSRHPWMVEFLGDESFYKDLKLWIKDNQTKYEIKEKQKPFIEKEKQKQKEYRKQVREWKLSKEPPTKAQLSYYKALCRKTGIKPDIEIEKASKLDLMKIINLFLEKDHSQEKAELIEKLNKIVRERNDLS
jgi:hypothetical protein